MSGTGEGQLRDAKKKSVTKVVVSFHTPFLYGMERSVIEIFEVRPFVQSEFVVTYTAERLHLPVLEEIRRRSLKYRFLPDWKGWPRIGKPKSLGEALGVFVALARGNVTHLKAAIGKDALYVPSTTYALQSFSAAVYMRLRGKRVIHRFHDFVDRPSRFLRLWSYLVTDFVHITETGKRAAETSNPWIQRKRSFVVPNLISEPTKTSPKACSGVSGNKREIVFAGQVSPHKGIDLLLKAIAVLRPRTDVRFRIMGSMQPEYAGEFEKLLRQAQKAAEVEVFGYQTDVMQWLRTAYLYVHPTPPSRCREGFARGVIEAMSVGVPSVCFASGSLSEIVVNEETGIICQEETPEALANAMERFLISTEFRNECGRRACQRYWATYSVESVRRKWVEFFCGVAEPTPSEASGL